GAGRGQPREDAVLASLVERHAQQRQRPQHHTIRAFRHGKPSGGLLNLSRTRDTVTGVGQSFEAALGDGGAALLAAAETALQDPLQGVVDLAQRLFLVLYQSERELLLEVVGTQVGGVQRRVGQAATTFAA